MGLSMSANGNTYWLSTINSETTSFWGTPFLNKPIYLAQSSLEPLMDSRSNTLKVTITGKGTTTGTIKPFMPKIPQFVRENLKTGGPNFRSNVEWVHHWPSFTIHVNHWTIIHYHSTLLNQPIQPLPKEMKPQLIHEPTIFWGVVLTKYSLKIRVMAY